MVKNAVRIMLEKPENNNYSPGRVLISGIMIERNPVREPKKQV